MDTAGRVFFKAIPSSTKLLSLTSPEKKHEKHMYVIMWTMHVDVACAACWVGKLNFASGSSSGGTALPEQKTQQVNGEKSVTQDIL